MGWVKAMWGEWPGYFPTYLLFLHFDYGAALAWPLGFVCFKAVRLSVFLCGFWTFDIFEKAFPILII